MGWVRALLPLAAAAGLCACLDKPCTAPTSAAECPEPVGACVDAGVGEVCPLLGATCGCCVAPAYDCTLLQCGAGADGGREWAWVTAIAPPECRPGT